MKKINKEKRIRYLEHETWSRCENLQRELRHRTTFQFQRIGRRDYAWFDKAVRLTKHAMEATETSIDTIIK